MKTFCENRNEHVVKLISYEKEKKKKKKTSLTNNDLESYVNKKAAIFAQNNLKKLII